LNSEVRWIYVFVILIIVMVFVYLCPLLLNWIENNDFKSTHMLIIWVKEILNSIETLLWFYLETFMWLNKFFPIIETLLWLKVIILTKISQDFTLIN